MKIILSRKGVDSTSGGFASPIFEDGQMVSIPIPQGNANIKYGDLQYGETNLGRIAEQLSGGRYTERDAVHFDPDINRNCIRRSPDWLPIFGQAGMSQGHLSAQRVSPGDIFLFFGWFRDVYGVPREPRGYRRGSPGYHVLWGWLQIGAVSNVDTTDWSDLAWTSYHPHRQYKADQTNTLYIATRDLLVDGRHIPGVAGGGVFDRFHEELRLTEPGQGSRSRWRLPRWFYPESGRTPMSFHSKLSRWQLQDDHVLLNAAGRGQEFVLDCDQYPEATNWATRLIASYGISRK